MTERADEYNTEPGAVKDEKRQKQEAELDAAALRTVMGTPAGRRVLRRIIELAGVGRISYVSERPGDTAFQEGRRNLGLALVGWIERDAKDLNPEFLIEGWNERTRRQDG